MSGRSVQPESLLEGASVRPDPPEAVRARVLAEVEREWRRHKRRRWRVPASVAATLLLAVTASFFLLRPGVVVVEISETGGLEVNGVSHEAGAELSLPAGAALEVLGSTRLLTAEGTEVRLRAGSRLTWRHAGAVSLEDGAIYVETDGTHRLTVHTPLGVVTDVGTTFMVTLESGTMEVAMRDGIAAVDTGHGSYTARARGGRRGDVVTVSPERASARTEPASAGRWAWIHGVHPGYRRREVLPLLQDIAEDLGLRLEFASPAVQAAALQSRLEGDLAGLTPDQALEVVLGATDFSRRESRREGAVETLVIGFQSPAD